MPRTLSVEEYKELGKRYYGRKDYQRALDAFTDGIDASVGRDIQLYDYRAATYDKLNNESAALADARHMIKAFEKDPRGYLRAGQLLLSMDKKPQALQIYARGLKYVPSSNTQINLLRGAHDKLNRELCPPKAVDPFTQFPYEIVELIMAHLKFYELVSCLRVSKQWMLFLEGLPGLWTKMDLLRAGTRNFVKASFVKTCMRMAQNKITSARIANFGHRGVLQALVTTCKTLERLEFVMTPLGTQSILEAIIPARALKTLIVHGDTEIHGSTMMQILKQRPTLEELRIHRVGSGCSRERQYDADLPKLRILDLRAVDVSFTSHHMHSLLQHIPNIREFTLDDTERNYPGRSVILPDFSHLQHLEVLRIKTKVLVGAPNANPLSLRSLDFETQGLPGVRAVRGYPFLRQLRMKTAWERPLDVLEADCGNQGVLLPDTSSMLKSLELCSARVDLPYSGSDVLTHPRLQDVEELVLDGGPAIDIDDREIPKLVSLKRLRRLQLHSARLTGVGLKQLITELNGTLKHLTLTACDNVGHDAVDWAARQGLEVIVHQERGGKVVRRRQ